MNKSMSTKIIRKSSGSNIKIDLKDGIPHHFPAPAVTRNGNTNSIRTHLRVLLFHDYQINE